MSTSFSRFTEMPKDGAGTPWTYRPRSSDEEALLTALLERFKPVFGTARGAKTALIGVLVGHALAEVKHGRQIEGLPEPSKDPPGSQEVLKAAKGRRR
jgi:hypothetical protein